MTSTADAPSTVAWRSSSPIPIGVITSCSLSTSMATTVPGWARAIRRAGPGLVAKFIQLYGHLDAQRFLEGGKLSAFNKEGGKR